MCLSVCMYECNMANLVVLGEGIWIKWPFLFCCLFFLFFHTKLPHFTGGNIESWWTERVFSQMTPPDRLHYKRCAYHPQEAFRLVTVSCCAMSFEVNFKASHVPLLVLWKLEMQEAETLSRAQRKLQSIQEEAPQEFVITGVGRGQPLQAPSFKDSCGVQLGPCLGNSAGDPSQARPRTALGYFCTQRYPEP